MKILVKRKIGFFCILVSLLVFAIAGVAYN